MKLKNKQNQSKTLPKIINKQKKKKKKKIIIKKNQKKKKKKNLYINEFF